MHLTKNALTMFLKRYRSILKKCHVLNVLGGMVLAGALTLGVAVSSAEAADVIKDTVVTGDTNITASDGSVFLQAGVNNATGTITATGTPDAAGNISAISAAGVNQDILQGAGNSLSLSASGSIKGGAMTVTSATAGKDINVTGTLQAGNITAGGNITTRVDTNAPAYDILVGSSTAAGSITAGGTITGGDITVYGNLTAERVQAYANSDNTITNNAGSVRVYGAVRLTGDSWTDRRFDISSTGASHNELGDLSTGA